MSQANLTIYVAGSYNGTALDKAEQKMKKVATTAAAASDTTASGWAVAGSSLVEFGAKADLIGSKAEALGTKVSTLLTLPIVALGTVAANTAMTFDTSMSQLSGALGEPISDLGDLRQLAIDTGKETIYSATESANAMTELAKGGLTEAQIQSGALASTMDLAAAGGLDLATAANTVVQQMGAFHLTANDTSIAVNALAGAANASSSDVSDLTEGLSQAAAQAANAGWTIQDTTAVLAAFADNGIKGSDAGTSLKTCLQRLAAPTDEAADAISSLGINVRDGNGNMLDAAGVAQELQSKLGGLSSAQRDAALQTIFGSDASRAALVLMNEGSAGIENYTAATNDQTAAQRMADAQLGDGQRALENMKGSLETAAIQLGEAIAPAVIDVANKVGDLADKFSSLDEGTQKNIVGALAFAAAAGPVLAAGGKLVTIIGSVSTGLGGAFQAASRFILGFTNADTTVKGFAVNLGKTAAQIRSGSAATEELAVSSSVAKAAIGGLVTAGLVVASIAIADFVQKQAEAKKTADDFTKATDGLNQTVEDSSSVLSAQGAAYGDLSSGVDNATQSFSDFIAAQAESASRISDTNQTASTNIGMLKAAQDAIEKYTNKTGLTTIEQGKLRSAIELVNGQCGTEYSVVDAANGKIADQQGVIQDTCAAIDTYIAKKMEQIRVDALQSDYEEAFKSYNDGINQQVAAYEKLTEVQGSYAGNLQQLKDALASGSITSDAYYAGLSDLEKNLSDAQGEYDKTTSSVDASKNAMDNFQTSMAAASSVASGSADAYQSFIDKHQVLSTAVDRTGGSLSDFISQLKQTGASTDDLANLSTEDLITLGSGYDGTINSIIDALEGMGVSCKSAGSDAATAWYEGLGSQQQAAITTALEVTGTTLDQFYAGAASAGLAGSDTVSAYASQIVAGEGNAQLLAQQVSAAAAGGLGSADATAAGQKVIDTYNAAIAAGDTVDEAIAKANEAVSGISTGDGSSAGAAIINTYNAGSLTVGTFGNAAAKAEDAKSGLSSVDAGSVGANLIKGFVFGFGDVNVWDAAWNIGTTALAALQQSIESNSPSKAARRLGRFVPQGFALGMSDDADLVVDSGMAIGQSALDSIGTYADASTVLPDLSGRRGDNGSTINGGGGQSQTTNYVTYRFDGGIVIKAQDLKEAKTASDVIDVLLEASELGTVVTQ